MAGSLTNNEKEKKQHQFRILNQQALKNFAELFYASKRANEKQAQSYWKEVEKIGFKSFQDSEWHCTRLLKVLSPKYKLNSDNIITIDKLKKIDISIDGWKIILFDGCFISAFNSDNFGPYQIQIMDTTENLPPPIMKEEIFLYLTESLAAQPILIKLPDNQHAEKPLYILNVTSGSNNRDYVNTSHYRYHLDIGSNCKSQVIEHFSSANDKPHLTGSRLTANIGNNSYFTHIKLSIENNQSNHFSNNDIFVGENAQMKSSGIFIGSEFFRQHTNVKLNGSNSKLILNSLLLPKNIEIVDVRAHVEHNKPFCKSSLLHKTIVMDESKSIFNGMIKVAPQALKSNSKMLNNNLLFGKQAEIKSKPQLEIYADDVKCSHGVTVSCIDNDQLFYLRSRGVCLNDAKYILMIGFASEIIKSIDIECVSDKITSIIQQHLTQI
ncbi:MAG: Fe-S cluster assembly protein SufD [Arsenophonus sp.]